MVVKPFIIIFVLFILLSGCTELNRFTLSDEEQKLVGTWMSNHGLGLRFESNRKIYYIHSTSEFYSESYMYALWGIKNGKLIYTYQIGEEMKLIHEYSLVENMLYITEYGNTVCYEKVV